MGISRYSKNPAERRKEELFDYLQMRCGWYDGVTIGDLTSAGIQWARFACRGTDCWHVGEPFRLDRFSGSMKIASLRWKYVCGECGAKRPHLRLDTTGYLEG